MERVKTTYYGVVLSSRKALHSTKSTQREQRVLWLSILNSRAKMLGIANTVSHLWCLQSETTILHLTELQICLKLR